MKSFIVRPFIVFAVVVALPLSMNAQQPAKKPIKSGLTDADRAYTMPVGVTAKEVTYYSEQVACYGKIFFPKGYSAEGKTPGIVLANGWCGLHDTLEKFAARFAERGMVAMAIDYRGWGRSGGFVRLAEPVRTDDRLRFHPMTAKVQIKRTRLIPEAQVEDIRNAISYLQGEPGVDRDRIGLWGTSYAGGHVITVAARDARVKAGVAQVPSIAGNGAPAAAFKPTPDMLKDAIQRARTGKDPEFQTGFSIKRMVDVETQQTTAEYRPFQYVAAIPETTAILFLPAENDELINNQTNAYAASKALKGPTKVVELKGITHFEAYSGAAFETGSTAAADWFLDHLK